MFVQILKSKIHRAKVTDANLNYDGSITIDKALMAAADLLPFEKVHVFNINTGARAETYVIEGEADSGTICCNGALARLATKGDLLIILAFEWFEKENAQYHTPNIIHVDDNNQIV
ncbi:MAG TPA: aspartate 1-decarboxylase [bacterium]|nr:aspartate 1-decarboxylase [bacterium]